VPRILELTWEYPPRLVGGIARHVAGLVPGLAAEGFEVVVVTQAPNGERSRTEESGVTIIRTVASGPSPRDFIEEIHLLNHALAQEAVAAHGGESFDLIHAHDWLALFAARALKHAWRVPLVATIHATERGRQRGIHNPTQAFIDQAEWHLCYEAWRVICCSQAMQAEIHSFFGCPEDKICVIPNGIDTQRRAPAAPEPQVRRQLALGADRIVLFVGRLVWEKGLAPLLRAWAEVAREAPEVRLVVVGGGDQGPWQALARECGVTDSVTFAGHVDEATLSSLYQMAQSAVMPSLYEPFGIVALEAMGSGVPVVGSEVGGLAEVVRQCQGGLLVPPDRPQALSRALLRVLTDRQLAGKLAIRGRESVEEIYSWRAIAKRTGAVLEEVLRERARTQWDDPVHPAGRNTRH